MNEKIIVDITIKGVVIENLSHAMDYCNETKERLELLFSNNILGRRTSLVIHEDGYCLYYFLLNGIRYKLEGTIIFFKNKLLESGKTSYWTNENINDTFFPFTKTEGNIDE